MHRARAFAVLLLLVLPAPRSPGRQAAPDAPEERELEASVSLTVRDVAYGGVTQRAGGILRSGEVFGWHDGSIRIAGMLDTAAGCAEPRGISARLTGRRVRVELEQAALCPAVLTMHRFYARVSGLRPGKYEVEILVPRGIREPGSRHQVEVPPPQPHH